MTRLQLFEALLSCPLLSGWKIENSDGLSLLLSPPNWVDSMCAVSIDVYDDGTIESLDATIAVEDKKERTRLKNIVIDAVDSVRQHKIQRCKFTFLGETMYRHGDAL